MIKQVLLCLLLSFVTISARETVKVILRAPATTTTQDYFVHVYSEDLTISEKLKGTNLDVIEIPLYGLATDLKLDAFKSSSFDLEGIFEHTIVRKANETESAVWVVDDLSARRLMYASRRCPNSCETNSLRWESLLPPPPTNPTTVSTSTTTSTNPSTSNPTTTDSTPNTTNGMATSLADSSFILFTLFFLFLKQAFRLNNYH